jgi:hypothetical protein
MIVRLVLSGDVSLDSPGFITLYRGGMISSTFVLNHSAALIKLSGSRSRKAQRVGVLPDFRY